MKSYKTKNMNLQLFAGEITDLTGTTWVFNNLLNTSYNESYYWYINFISNLEHYGALNREYMSGPFGTEYDYLIYDVGSDISDIYAYEDGSWEGTPYRTIAITGGSDATNSTLISWLQANATQVQSGYESLITLTNCTCNKSSETGLSGSYSATITADDGYYLSSVTTTLGTATIATNKKTATIEISDVNADFTISATGTAKSVENTIMHPYNMTTQTIDYTTDLLPKAQSDASKQNLLTTTSVSDGTINKNIGFDGNGNIVKAAPESIPSVTLTTTTGSEGITVDNSSLTLVTRDTAQTISGAKNFSTDVTFDNNKYIKGKVTGGTAYNLIGVNASNGLVIGNASMSVTLNTSSNVIPGANGTKDLGSSSYKWKDIYLSGNLSDGTNSVSVANIESKGNKVTSISSSSTDTQYPSAKCVYDLVGDVETLLTALNTGTGV